MTYLRGRGWRRVDMDVLVKALSLGRRFRDKHSRSRGVLFFLFFFHYEFLRNFLFFFLQKKKKATVDEEIRYLAVGKSTYISTTY